MQLFQQIQRLAGRDIVLFSHPDDSFSYSVRRAAALSSSQTPFAGRHRTSVPVTCRIDWPLQHFPHNIALLAPETRNMMHAAG
jgi:hypothetical protein